MNTRLLSNDEIGVIKQLLSASDLDVSTELSTALSNVKVYSVNDDGSIIALCRDIDVHKSSDHSPLNATGLVQDIQGNLGEVLLFVDQLNYPTELEIVSYGEQDIRTPMWSTFRLVNSAKTASPTV